MSLTTVVNKYKVVHWDIDIGRPGPYQNRYTHKPSKFRNTIRVNSRMEAIRLFRLEKMRMIQKGGKAKAEVIRQCWELKGKVLGCYCKPLPCHGDVWVSLIYLYCKERRRST